LEKYYVNSCTLFYLFLLKALFVLFLSNSDNTTLPNKQPEKVKLTTLITPATLIAFESIANPRLRSTTIIKQAQMPPETRVPPVLFNAALLPANAAAIKLIAELIYASLSEPTVRTDTINALISKSGMAVRNHDLMLLSKNITSNFSVLFKTEIKNTPKVKDTKSYYSWGCMIL